ncbi:leucine-rich repeat domain-containing protein [Paenibacillus sp. FSL R7-0345]|uniref:leucine-rich repeat domain-containing protein n=1 Tax=Paenibacillus sp. FSL R7-0345 TaxID=2954535 RepID=UPI00315B16C6
MNKNDDESLTKEDLESLTDVFLSGKGIKSLQGLEYAVNVTTLDLSRNPINDLSPLAGLIKLRRLEAADNNIKDLAPVSKTTGLG